MKTFFTPSGVSRTLFLLAFVFTFFSCSEDLVLSEESAEPVAAVEKEEVEEKRDCTYRGAPFFSGSQSCQDISRPRNVGRLDCRAKTPSGQATAGYREFNSFGVYTIYGDFTADTRRSVRVERRFNNIDRGSSKSAQFTARFKISDLSTAHTYIAQMHGTGNVVVGACRGKKHTSAMWLLRVERKSGSSNVYNVFREETVNPYVQDGSGSCARGSRRKVFLRTINRNQEYTLRVTGGFNSSQRSFTSIKIGGSTYNHNVAFTTQKMYFRYGAYNAQKTGSIANRKSVVRYKDTRYCHPT